MLTGTRSRLAVALAAGVLAVWSAQAPASAGEADAQSYINGASTTFCSTAVGDYSYSRIPGTDQYNAGWDIWIDNENHCGMESVLRVKYSVWWEGAWRPQPWMTIASTTANSNSNKYESRVKDVRFAICDYVPGGSYTACGYVS